MIDHLNVSQLAPWFHERFLVGRVIAGRRAVRVALVDAGSIDIVGSPMIPVVICRGSGVACVRLGARPDCRSAPCRP